MVINGYFIKMLKSQQLFDLFEHNLKENVIAPC